MRVKGIAVIGVLVGVLLMAAGCAKQTAATEEAAHKVVLETVEDQNADISFLPLDVYMKPVSYENGELTVVIDNQSGYDFRFGKEYTLQKKDGENWVDVEPVKEYGWTKIALMVKDLETAEETYDLSVFGDLEAGTYKLVKDNIEAEFTLVNEK